MNYKFTYKKIITEQIELQLSHLQIVEIRHQIANQRKVKPHTITKRAVALYAYENALGVETKSIVGVPQFEVMEVKEIK